MYAHLVICLASSRDFIFFVHFRQSPRTSDETDELASIVYKKSAGIDARAIQINQICHIDCLPKQKIHQALVTLFTQTYSGTLKASVH